MTSPTSPSPAADAHTDQPMDRESDYDALLLVAFGGPEGPDQVGPFLERVAAGREIPPERLAEVAARYDRFGGVSPLNGHMRSLVAAIGERLATRHHDLPVFWGNRNAHPLLVDVVASLRDEGAERVLAWVSSPYSSYPTCRQYGDDLDAACRAVGSGAPRIDRVRPHHDHPGLIEPAADRLIDALAELPPDRRDGAHLLFTAHSIPSGLAATCGYEAQLHDAAGLVAGLADPDGNHPWEVVWQSRSGSPHVPWLEPDVGDRIDALAADGVRAVVVAPLGMPIESFEIAWDLDVEAAGRAAAAGISFVRARAVDDDPRFASMVVDLFEERLGGSTERRSLGGLGIRPDTCPADCCPAPSRS